MAFTGIYRHLQAFIDIYIIASADLCIDLCEFSDYNGSGMSELMANNNLTS